MKLYRGDNIFNTTEPGRYRMDGIRSKSFGKGIPQYIKSDQLIENIRRHVNPISPLDKAIYDKTEFISFTTSRKKALYWLTDQGSRKIEDAAEDFTETRYIFTLNIDPLKMVPLDVEQTMFSYRFYCNPLLKTLNSDDLVEQAMHQFVADGTWFKSCPICNLNDQNHAIVLIDTPKYLEAYKSSTAYDGAIVNAVNDQEWLVLPTDSLSGFTGTTIPRADFWKAEHYITKGEYRPSNMYRIDGQMFDGDGQAI